MTRPSRGRSTSKAAREHDEFDVFNTPSANLITNLVGGSGQNSFYVAHGGVNENIAITGGTGVNTLTLDRSQSSAAAPDSLALAAGSTIPGGPLNVVRHHRHRHIDHGVRRLHLRDQHVRRDVRRGRLGAARVARHVPGARRVEPRGRPESRRHRAPARQGPGQRDGQQRADRRGHGHRHGLLHRRPVGAGRRADQAQRRRFRDGQRHPDTRPLQPDLRRLESVGRGQHPERAGGRTGLHREHDDRRGRRFPGPGRQRKGLGPRVDAGRSDDRQR